MAKAANGGRLRLYGQSRAKAYRIEVIYIIPIYGIKRGICGVYEIRNNITDDFYIGASVDISGRLSTHFGRETKIQKDHIMYRDILKFGRDSFSWRVLEECDKEHLLEREQYYYDTLHPTYNIVRPSICPFYDPLTQNHAKSASNTPKVIETRRQKYNEPYYKELFSKQADWKKKPVEALYNGEVVGAFESLRECQRWLDGITDFTGKNKCSKIKAVCDGERPSAYGYQFRYAKCRDYPEME